MTKKQYGRIVVYIRNKDDLSNLKITELIKPYKNETVITRHLCAECALADIGKCKKMEGVIGELQIEDIDAGKISKKPIMCYPFISQGFQIFDEDGSMTHFIVQECKNFIPEVQTKKLNLLLQREIE